MPKEDLPQKSATRYVDEQVAISTHVAIALAMHATAAARSMPGK